MKEKTQILKERRTWSHRLSAMLAIILAVVMVVGMMPQSTLTVYAATESTQESGEENGGFFSNILNSITGFLGIGDEDENNSDQPALYFTEKETDDDNIDETLQDSDTQSVFGEDTSQSDKEPQVTQQESENQEEAETTQETTADIMTLSENRELTEDVIKNELNGVIDSNKIPLSSFVFTTDVIPSPDSEDIKEQAAGGQTEVSPGAVGNLFEDEITLESNNYVFKGITVGGVDVYHIGTIKIQNTTYIYYITDRVKTNTTVYTVLNDENDNSKQFTVTYSRADRYDIEYVIQDKDGNGQEHIGDYDKDAVFGADRTTHLDVTEDASENDSYTVERHFV